MINYKKLNNEIKRIVNEDAQLNERKKRYKARILRDNFNINLEYTSLGFGEDYYMEDILLNNLNVIYICFRKIKLSIEIDLFLVEPYKFNEFLYELVYNLYLKRDIIWDDHVGTFHRFNRNRDKNKFSKCSICLENYKNNEIIRCIHDSYECSFHKKCINKWFKINNTCPNCRKIIK